VDGKVEFKIIANYSWEQPPVVTMVHNECILNDNPSEVSLGLLEMAMGFEVAGTFAFSYHFIL